MNELIRAQKQDYLAGLKNAKKTIEDKVAIRENEIYAQKLVVVQNQEAQLDQSFQKYVDDENAKLNELINAKREQVAAAKTRLNQEASRIAHEAAVAETAGELKEIEAEIARVKTELGE